MTTTHEHADGFTASPRVVGLLGTGHMGAALGRALLHGGHDVRCALDGRSARSRELAATAGLRDMGTLDRLVAGVDVVLSVVPPARAVEAARDVAAAALRTGSTPLVADLNAVAPQTVGEVGDVLTAAGCDLVDGSISSGPPTGAAKPARVYLAGPRARELAALTAPAVDWRLLDGPAGSASALKMCTASMYKGFTALAMQAMVTARQYGVLAPFLADIAREWPEQVPDLHTSVALAATKAERFVGEMREIARAQAGAGLPDALFAGVAVAYDAVAGSPLARQQPETLDRDMPIEEVLAALTAERPGRGVRSVPVGAFFDREPTEGLPRPSL